MSNTFDAIGNNGDDRDFLVELINDICSYAVDNDMSPNETLKSIADNIITLTEITNFDNWGRE